MGRAGGGGVSWTAALLDEPMWLKITKLNQTGFER